MEGLGCLFQSISISQYKIFTYYYLVYYEQRSELKTKLNVCGRTEFKKLSLALLADTGGL